MSDFGATRTKEAAAVGEWVFVPYSGDHSRQVDIGVEVDGEVQWTPAFLDGPRACIRVPDVEEGLHRLWARVRGSEARQVGTIEVWLRQS